ncbi:MAG: hypothetical protein HN377_09670, partial [Alphaproteobacteria bacterium]|nr:hypothetical protein [Alphaproteobacteria bacterium]
MQVDLPGEVLVGDFFIGFFGEFQVDEADRPFLGIRGAEIAMKIAFVAGLSEAKLKQKLIPLSCVDCVEEITLFRKFQTVKMNKVSWKNLPV